MPEISVPLTAIYNNYIKQIKMVLVVYVNILNFELLLNHSINCQG